MGNHRASDDGFALPKPRSSSWQRLNRKTPGEQKEKIALPLVGYSFSRPKVTSNVC